MKHFLSFLVALLLLRSTALGAVGFGAAGTGTTSRTTVAYPAGIAAGDLLVLFVSLRYDTATISTPTGWTAPSNNTATGGVGTNSADSGQTKTVIFVKEAVGTETGNLTISIAGDNIALSIINRYTKGTGSWDVACSQGSDNTATTSWSVTGNVDPGITANDLVLVLSTINADAHTSVDSEVLAATGVTFGAMTERRDVTSSGGFDIGQVISEHPASSGTSSAAPTYTMTAATSDGSKYPAGSTVILRLRETPSGIVPILSRYFLLRKQ